VPASSDSKQQAAGTAIKQAKARRAAPNSDPLVRFLSRSPARACAKSLAVSAPRRAASRSHTDMSSSCLLLQPGTRHPYAGRWPQHTAIRNPLDFARWVLPIKARGRYTLCSDIHRAEGARRVRKSNFWKVRLKARYYTRSAEGACYVLCAICYENDNDNDNANPTTHNPTTATGNAGCRMPARPQATGH
jgi:hypothetical protein